VLVAAALAVRGAGRAGWTEPLLHLHPLVAFVGLLIAGSSLLTLEVRSNAFSISLTEVPIVLCLLGMGRVPFLVAGTVGAFAALLLSPRRTPLKLTFNTALIVLEMALAGAVYDMAVDTPDLTDWRTWTGVILATVSASIVSGAAVNVVIRAAGDTTTLRQAVHHSLLGVANAVAATVLTLLGLLNLQVSVLTAVPLAFLAVVAIVPMRRFARLQRRYDGLLTLHEFTAGLTGSTDLEPTLARVLREAAKVLRCEHAAIVLPRSNGTFRRSLRQGAEPVATPGDPLWQEVVVGGRPVRLTRGSSDLAGYLDRHGVRDLMGVPLTQGGAVIGALVVWGRLGDVSTFDADDLTIFSTMANQTTVTLDNLSLIDRLRDESAERAHQALHDSLTGLPNRTYLLEAVDRVIAAGSGVVAMLDLNRFKDVNDTLGHHVGDAVLIETAERLRRVLPPSAVVARLGGDEFAVVIDGVGDVDDARSRLSHVELAFVEPVRVEGLGIRIDGSIGAAVVGLHGSDRATLLQRADVAMYAAKAQRRTTVCVYDPGQERASKRSLAIVSALRDAVDEGQLDVAFQPIAGLDERRATGAEALARWHHPVLGRVGPDEFIPIAERAGLTEAITGLVLAKALDACRGWRQAGHGLTVSVNVDGPTLLAPGFTELVLGALRLRGLPAQVLKIEITERELLRELQSANEVVGQLRRAGVSLSIDDFGTGYSSLSYLSHLEVDEVKIDRSFVSEVISSPLQRAIVRAIADIASASGATTVAEGVEDEATWQMMAVLGCRFGQGYHMARPMPLDDLMTWLARTTDPVTGIVVPPRPGQVGSGAGVTPR
jgi:diguanylate cyclase (GGDEF)-like protein